MTNTNDNDKLFGDLALGLLVAGLLVPFIIAVFANQALAMGFGAIALFLAIVFGILGWKHKTGKVAVIIAAVVFVLLLGYSLLPFGGALAEDKPPPAGKASSTSTDSYPAANVLDAPSGADDKRDER